MLLRRMIEHVRAQNWTAVAIDFVIVVVGVFIGIQVANWNDGQAAKRRGADYAQRLVVDLSSDLAYRRAIAGYYESVLQSASTAVVLLASAQPNPTELVVNTYRATEFAFTPQTRSTWDEIVSSGEIGLLPRAAVEHGLAFYYGANAADLAAEAIVDSPLRQRVRRAIPHPVQQAIRGSCSDTRDRLGYIDGFTAECRLDVSDRDILAAVTALKNDPELLGDLTLHFSVLNTTRASLRREIGFLESAIKSLGGDESRRE